MLYLSHLAVRRPRRQRLLKLLNAKLSRKLALIHALATLALATPALAPLPSNQQPSKKVTESRSDRSGSLFLFRGKNKKEGMSVLGHTLWCVRISIECYFLRVFLPPSMTMPL